MKNRMRLFVVMIMLAGFLVISCSSEVKPESSEPMTENLRSGPKLETRALKLETKAETNDKQKPEGKTCPLCGQKNNSGGRCSFCDKKL